MMPAPSRWVRSGCGPLGCSHQPKRLATQGTRKPVRATLTMLPRNSEMAKGSASLLVRNGVATKTPNRKTIG